MENWNDYSKDYTALNNAVGNTFSNTFEELPDGEYFVKPLSLELKRSKANNPMVAACFSVVSGEHANRRIYVNMLLLRDGSQKDYFFVHRCNEFLKGFGIITDVSLTTVPVYAQTVQYIADQALGNNYYYTLEILTTTSNGRDYKNYQIVAGPLTYEPQA